MENPELEEDGRMVSNDIIIIIVIVIEEICIVIFYHFNVGLFVCFGCEL